MNVPAAVAIVLTVAAIVLACFGQYGVAIGLELICLALLAHIYSAKWQED